MTSIESQRKIFPAGSCLALWKESN